MSGVNNRVNCNNLNGIPTVWANCGNRMLPPQTRSINVTQMKGYISGTCNSYTDVYEVPNLSVQTICSPYFPPDFVCGNCENSNVYCVPIDDTYFQPASGLTHSFSVSSKYHNNYITTSVAASNNVCSNIGFKAVAGNKNWNGKLPYNSRELGAYDSFDWCGNACMWHNLDSTPETTRYLTVSANCTDTIVHVTYTTSGSINGQYYCDGVPYPNNCYSKSIDTIITTIATSNSTGTIDKYGNPIVNTCASSSNAADPDTAASDALAALNALSIANDHDITSLQSIYVSRISYYAGNPTLYYPLTSGGGNSRTVQFTQSYSCTTDACGTTVVSDQIAAKLVITPSTLDYYEYSPLVPGVHCDTDGSCETWGEIKHEHWSVSATELHYGLKSEFSGGFSPGSRTTIVSCSLGSSYTSTDVANDVTTALAAWDMGDDNQYPWRQDGNVTQMPLVSYDEDYGAQPLVLLCTGSINFTGEILGKPTTVNIDRVRIPTHQNYCVCAYYNDFGELVYVLWPKDEGAWSTDVCNVPRATQALNIFQSNNLPQGALTGNGFMLGIESSITEPTTYQPLKFWGVKYAETIFNKQSYNLFRPAGYDRFEMSQSSGRCITDISTGSNTITVTPDATPFTTNDKIWVCGTGPSGSNIDGLYNIASVAGTVLHLSGSVMVKASSLYLPPNTNCGIGLGTVSKLKWENPLQPAILGSLPIVSATSTNPVTCSFNSPIWFVDGDTVCISGVTGLTAMNGTHSVKSIDSSRIALTDVNGVGFTYGGNGIMISPNTPDQSWNTSTPYGSAAYKNWYYNFRDVGEYVRLNALSGALSGSTACDGITQCGAPYVPPNPRYSQSLCGLYQTICNTPSQPICNSVCLPYFPCFASVLYSSPNSESFNATSSYNIGWHNALIDNQYTALWQAIPSQQMYDPLAITPPRPCGLTGSYVVDNYTCAGDVGDTVSFYPAPNRYEYMCSVPTGSPALPPNVYIGCLNTSDLTGSCVGGNICLPPSIPNAFPYAEGCGNSVYMVNIYSTPWIDRLNASNCINSSGRWSSFYAPNFIP